MSLPKGFKPGIQFAGHLTTQFVVLLVALAQETGLLPEARFSWYEYNKIPYNSIQCHTVPYDILLQCSNTQCIIP